MESEGCCSASWEMGRQLTMEIGITCLWEHGGLHSSRAQGEHWNFAWHWSRTARSQVTGNCPRPQPTARMGRSSVPVSAHALLYLGDNSPSLNTHLPRRALDPDHSSNTAFFPDVEESLFGEQAGTLIVNCFNSLCFE